MTGPATAKPPPIATLFPAKRHVHQDGGKGRQASGAGTGTEEVGGVDPVNSRAPVGVGTAFQGHAMWCTHVTVGIELNLAARLAAAVSQRGDTNFLNRMEDSPESWESEGGRISILPKVRSQKQNSCQNVTQREGGREM